MADVEQRWLTDPTAVIAEAVMAAEPTLNHTVVQSVIETVIQHRPRRRDLARALVEDPQLLVSGRPVGPRGIERLVRALQEQGATNLVLPRCARCGKPNPLPSVHGEVRVCAYCYAVLRAQARREPCSGCGQVRVVRQRDRDGRPRCQACPVDIDADPVAALVALVQAVEPQMSTRTIAAAVMAAAGTGYEHQRLLWALEADPNLLTSDVVHGSRRLLALVTKLQGRGAGTIAVPPCPLCGQVARLNRVLDGRRCCRLCWERKTQVGTCARCGRQRPRIARAPEGGGSLCSRCQRRDPVNHDPCSGCQQVRLIVRNDGGRRLCARCFRAPTAVCASCGQTRPCYFAGTDRSRCERCAVRARVPQPCTVCGHVRKVNVRTLGGQPLCASCTRPKAPCDGCAKVKHLHTELPDGRRLCSYCYSKDDAAIRPCHGCGVLARPYHFGLCPACACQRRLGDLLAGNDGRIRPELEPVHAALSASDPTRVLLWLRYPAPAGVLAALACMSGPVTHEILDQLRPFRSVQHLRAALVAGGVLPARDENLAHLPEWIDKTTAQLGDPGERRVVRAFATWHHLRRLRRQTEPVTDEQVQAMRADVKAAVHLLGWLHQHGSSLATCQQAHLDQWAADQTWRRGHACSFLRWAVRNRHAPRVTLAARRSEYVGRTLAADRRWALVRRLLHDDTLDPADRVAGLLLLLFAQPLARIARLRTNQIIDDNRQVALALGSEPVQLPPPVNELVLELLQQRHGHAAVGRTTEHPWLFPGGRAGRPLSSNQMLRRMKALGIVSRSARNTVLMEFAAEMPAVVLSKLLGISPSTATRWTEYAGAPAAGYAADLARRANRRRQ